jgi:hypothetical protein
MLKRCEFGSSSLAAACSGYFGPCNDDVGCKIQQSLLYSEACSHFEGVCSKKASWSSFVDVLGMAGGAFGFEGHGPEGEKAERNLFGDGAGVEVAESDLALRQLLQGKVAKASELDEFGASQGWTRSRKPNGPIVYTDENGVKRLIIKRGTSRVPGSENPHVEMRNAAGERVDSQGNVVSKRSPGNHTPIDYDLP